MDLRFSDEFSELGLNGRQSAVYMTLLRLGEGTAIDIARAAQLKHPTVYDALEVLEKRMLVTESLRNGRKIFSACNPESLRRTEELRRSALERILPELTKMYLNGGQHQEMRCLHGSEAYKLMSQELLNCRDREYFYFGQLSVMLKRQGLEYEQRYLNERLKRGIRSHAIRLRENHEIPECMRGTPENLREVRYISGKLPGDIAELYLFDEKAVILSPPEEDYMLLIESKTLHTLLMALWKIVWEHASE